MLCMKDELALKQNDVIIQRCLSNRFVFLQVPPRPSFRGGGYEQSRDEGSSSSGLIAGITVSFGLLYFFIIIGILLYRRRHSK